MIFFSHLLKTVTVATFDLVPPASLDTIHLYCCDSCKFLTTSLLLLLLLILSHCCPFLFGVCHWYAIDPLPVPLQFSGTLISTVVNWLVGWVVIVGGPVDTYVIMSYLLVQYSPYTFTVVLLDTTDPASLLTLHLYVYSPTVRVVSVVYDVVLSLLTAVQLLPEIFLSQECISVPRPLALHIRVVLLPIATSPPLGCFVISGGPKQVY